MCVSNGSMADPVLVAIRFAGGDSIWTIGFGSGYTCRAAATKSMARKDPRIDAYIANSAAFAQPILKHLRRIVHAGCPDAEETMKWRMPHFDYKGMLCHMAAFKQHCAFGFWN